MTIRIAHLGLGKAGAVARIHQEHDGVDSGEVIAPHAPRLLMPAQVERREPHTAYGQLLRCWGQNYTVIKAI